jgi:hypothetical protein
MLDVWWARAECGFYLLTYYFTIFLNLIRENVLLISKINKTVTVASSWSSIFTLPTLMMHGQTQIKKMFDYNALISV